MPPAGISVLDEIQEYLKRSKNHMNGSLYLDVPLVKELNALSMSIDTRNYMPGVSFMLSSFLEEY